MRQQSPHPYVLAVSSQTGSIEAPANCTAEVSVLTANNPLVDNVVMYQTRQDVIHKLLHNTSPGSSSSTTSSQNDRSLARQKQWSDPEKFFEDNLQEVYDKLPNLEKQIWGKLVVMEGCRRTAKAYLRHPLITVDGSDSEFDGMRVGISRFENIHRTDIVYEIFNEVLQGIKIKIDPDGNVWAKRMCYSPVFLKPLYRSRANDLFIIDQRPVKVFDIRRFKEILVYELRQSRPDRRKLEKCCLICLKFSIDHYDILRTPCYIVIIHLVAIELLNLVLPKDHELSSPSHSFIAARPTAAPPPPPSGSQEACTNMPAHNGSPPLNGNMPMLSAFTPLRASGRVSKGGVFKRIIRKEEENIRGQHLSSGLSGPRLHQDNDDSDFDSLPRYGSRGHERDYASMQDLRHIGGRDALPVSIGQFNSSHFDFATTNLGDGVDSARRLGERVYSMEGLSSQPELARSSHLASYGVTQQNIKSQIARMKPSKKWRSQDSGIGSGSGSYGSK